MSAVPSTPSTPGRASAVASRSSSSPPVGHRQRRRRRRAARRGPGGRRRRASAGRSAPTRPVGRRARGGQLGDPPGLRTRVSTQVGDVDVRVASCARPLEQRPRARRWSASRRRRRAARRRTRRRRWRSASIRSTSQPASRPWHSAPPNASPAPRPLTTSTGTGGTTTELVAAHAQHARRALLDDGELDPGREQRRGGRARGRVSPIATSHSSQVADRDVDAGRAAALMCVVGLVARRPEHRPVVEVEDGGAVRRRAPPARPWWPRGDGSCAEAGAGDPEDVGGRDRVEVELVGVDLEVGRRRAAGRSRAGSRRAGRSRRTSPASAGPATAVTKRSSTPKPAQRLVDEAAERVVAGAGDHRGAAAVPGGGDGDVGRAAAEELAERRRRPRARRRPARGRCRRRPGPW